MSQPPRSPHKRAWQTYTRQFPQVLGLLLVQVIVRLVAFTPLIFAIISGRFLGFRRELAPAYGFLCSLPLYVLLVMPFRFQAAATKANLLGLARDHRITPGNYARWLTAALLRLLRALPFLALFWGFVAAFYYVMRMQPFNDALLSIHRIGKAVGGDYPEGIALIGLVGLLVSLLAAWAWKRGLAFEHQDVVALGIAEASRRAADLRKRRRKTINRTVFYNLLLCLPALATLLVLLIGWLLSLPRVGMLALDFVNIIGQLLAFKLPGSTTLYMGIALAVLWLPLLPLRKLALAAVHSEQTENR